MSLCYLQTQSIITGGYTNDVSRVSWHEQQAKKWKLSSIIPFSLPYLLTQQPLETTAPYFLTLKYISFHQKCPQITVLWKFPQKKSLIPNSLQEDKLVSCLSSLTTDNQIYLQRKRWEETQTQIRVLAKYFYFKMYILTGIIINGNFVKSSTSCCFINEK